MTYTHSSADSPKRDRFKFFPYPIAELAPFFVQPSMIPEWIWEGYLRRGQITMLVSPTKVGKTTLITHLIRAMAAGGTFLGQPIQTGKVLILSDEDWPTWAERHRAKPLPDSMVLASTPFLHARATLDDWDDLLKSFAHIKPDLIIIDTLASVLPPFTESSIDLAREFLEKLRYADGRSQRAILILHHPSKSHSSAVTPRGSGYFASFTDILLELRHASHEPHDAMRRKLIGRSRSQDTPRELTYELCPVEQSLVRLAKPADLAFQDHWPMIREIVTAFPDGLTVEEIRNVWPGERRQPDRRVLSAWLNRAHAEGMLTVRGKGVKGDPGRFAIVK